jgi:hypothetical protein
MVRNNDSALLDPIGEKERCAGRTGVPAQRGFISLNRKFEKSIPQPLAVLADFGSVMSQCTSLRHDRRPKSKPQ